MVHTRTGRQFFDDDLTQQLIDDIAAAVTSAGLWEELGTDWLLLDCELLPWNVKAEGLLRSQYASVAAAGRSDLTAREAVLARAGSRGLDVAGLSSKKRRI